MQFEFECFHISIVPFILFCALNLILITFDDVQIILRNVHNIDTMEFKILSYLQNIFKIIERELCPPSIN